MQFDGALMITERSRNLLVHPAVHHVPEPPLAVGECGKTELELLPPGARAALVRITLESPLGEASNACFGAHLWRKSTAPWRRADIALGTSPCPVRNTNGSSAPASAHAACSCRPSQFVRPFVKIVWTPPG
jgi:hypothetical protein